MSKYKGSRFHQRSAKQHLLRQGNLCGICQKPILNMKDASIDHIIPVSKGGPDTLKNMQLAHVECNQKKGNFYESDDMQ